LGVSGVIFEIRPEVNVAGYPPTYPAGTRTGTGYCDRWCIACILIKTLKTLKFKF